MTTKPLATIKTTGLYLLIFLFTLLWLAACSDQPKIRLDEASTTSRATTACEAHCRVA